MRRALVRVLAAALAFAALPAGAAAPAPAVAAPPALRGLDERFVSGTPVETRDGPRPIEQVREGDWVLAWDEDAGELCWSRVEQTFVTPRQPIWRLTLKLPDGSEESLDCTPGHPFWADGEGWVPACHLQPGQDVATLSGPARVASVAPTGRNRTVYNFEVEGTHCYFVGTGGELVHNGCGPGRSGKQTRLRELSHDPNVSRADRGWLKQEINALRRSGGKRTTIRLPRGKELAHRRGFEARKGFSYKYSDLQTKELHTLQHTHEGY